MKIAPDSRSLWVCTSDINSGERKSGLFQIDLPSGKVLTKHIYKGDSATLFNDLVIHSNGDIYLTDSRQNTVFRYNPAAKKLELWLQNDQLTLANGITLSADESILFVASGNKGIQRIDMQTKKISPVGKGKRTDYGIDGLLYKDKTLIGIIGWPNDRRESHRIIRYRLSDDCYLSQVDTLHINKPYINVPTTGALHRNRLFLLSKTNIGLYFANGQDIDKIKDSLEFPQILSLLVQKVQ